MSSSLFSAQPLPDHGASRRRPAIVVRAALALMVAGGLLVTSGCGNKGPLYLPPAAPITEVGPGVPGQDVQPEDSDTVEQNGASADDQP